jgi:nitroreductase
MNDHPFCLTAMHDRRSVPANELTEPAPSGAALEAMLKAAASVPDHGQLQPGRLLLIQGAGRAQLGEIFAEALKARDPEASAEQIDKVRYKNQVAPLIIVIIAHIRHDIAKVPASEQWQCVGAMAMNLLNAATLLGFAGIWYTGAHAYDRRVAAALGLAAAEHLAGFLYFGTPKNPVTPKKRREIHEFVQHWPAPTEK